MAKVLLQWGEEIFQAIAGVGSLLQGLDSILSWIPLWMTVVGSVVISGWLLYKWQFRGGVIRLLLVIKMERKLVGILALLLLPRVIPLVTLPPPTPDLDFSLHSGRENEYAPGYKVHDLEWKPGFSMHTFSIQNKSKTVEAYGFRTSLVLPRPIYSYKVKDKVGVNEVDVRRIGLVAGEYTDKDWRVVGSRDIYSNAIFINADKLGYESFLTIELILDLNRKDGRYAMNIIDAKYWYSSNEGKKSLSKSEVYNVKKRDGSSALYVDKANPLRVSPLSFDYEHSFTSVLGENTDVKNVEDKHFRFHIEYPFMIPTDRPHQFKIKYPPYVSEKKE